MKPLAILKKAQNLLGIAEHPHQKLDNDDPQTEKLPKLIVIADQPDHAFEKEVSEQLEEALRGLTLQDLEDYEKILPFQGELKELLKDVVDSATKNGVFEDLQAKITDMASQAKQRQIYKKDRAKAKEYDAKIEVLIEEIIKMIRSIREDAHLACSMLTQKYFKKEADKFKLDKAIIKAIQKKLYLGLSCLVGGFAAIAAGAGAALMMEEVVAFGAMGLTVPGGVVPAFMAATLLLIGMGTWKVIESRKLKKKHPKFVELYEEMKKVKKTKISFYIGKKEVIVEN